MLEGSCYQAFIEEATSADALAEGKTAHAEALEVKDKLETTKLFVETLHATPFRAAPAIGHMRQVAATAVPIGEKVLWRHIGSRMLENMRANGEIEEACNVLVGRSTKDEFALRVVGDAVSWQAGEVKIMVESLAAGRCQVEADVQLLRRFITRCEPSDIMETRMREAMEKLRYLFTAWEVDIDTLESTLRTLQEDRSFEFSHALHNLPYGAEYLRNGADALVRRLKDASADGKIAAISMPEKGAFSFDCAGDSAVLLYDKEFEWEEFLKNLAALLATASQLLKAKHREKIDEIERARQYEVESLVQCFLSYSRDHIRLLVGDTLSNTFEVRVIQKVVLESLAN